MRERLNSRLGEKRFSLSSVPTMIGGVFLALAAACADNPGPLGPAAPPLENRQASVAHSVYSGTAILHCAEGVQSVPFSVPAERVSAPSESVQLGFHRSRITASSVPTASVEIVPVVVEHDGEEFPGEATFVGDLLVRLAVQEEGLFLTQELDWVHEHGEWHVDRIEQRHWSDGAQHIYSEGHRGGGWQPYSGDEGNVGLTSSGCGGYAVTAISSGMVAGLTVAAAALTMKPTLGQSWRLTGGIIGVSIASSAASTRLYVNCRRGGGSGDGPSPPVQIERTP